MQITDLSKEMAIPAFLRLGFRPFFSLASLFAIFAIGFWLLVFSGHLTIQLHGGGTFWHVHEMIFGFACAVIVGFLLTAVQTWTGQRAINHWPLLLLATLWLIGRLAMLLPTFLGEFGVAFFDLLFLPYAAYSLAKPIVKVKQQRNLFFIPILMVFWLLNLGMHLSLWFEQIDLRALYFTAVMLITLLMSIMIGRITPIFTANGTNTKAVTQIKWLENTANITLLTLTLCFFISVLVPLPNTLFMLLLFIAGTTQSIRLIRYKPWITLKTPLLWSLHAAIGFICFGLVALSTSYYYQQLYSNHIWHLLTIGGMGGLILAMMSRVSLGHTGYPLVPHKLMSLAFVCLIASPVLRAFGPLLFPQSLLTYIWLSGVVWVIAFTCFAYVYIPILSRTRADGRPG